MAKAGRKTTVQFDGVETATVDDFTYVGGNITRDGEVASKAYLRPSIFWNEQLNMAINREVYCAVVLPILLYGTEKWSVKADNCEERITSKQLADTCPSLSTTQLESSDWRKRTTTQGLNS